jgi:hypothetical protein
MKQKLIFLFLLLLIFVVLIELQCFSGNEIIREIAVVSSKFDPIEKTLDKYRIAHRKCNYSDLEKKEFYNHFRLIFFPCGVENTIETNVNILSRGTRIHSVSLKKDFLDINEDLIFRNIKSFIENGGNAYFSDYSYKLLEGAFRVMEFYDNFPNLGISGQIDLALKNNLFFFCKTPTYKAELPHPGWVVVKSIQNSEVLAVSTFNTIRDIKTSPVISLLERGLGEAIFTSYHRITGDDEISRFIIYRLAYKYLSDKLESKASTWEQTINCTIIDSIREWENFRSYTVPLKEGNNTLYFNAEKGYHQIDLYDSDSNLILSADPGKTFFYININSESDQNITARVYPANPKLLGVYSMVIGSGMRIFPYYKRILFVIFFIVIILALYWINKTIGIKKFSGRSKYF